MWEIEAIEIVDGRLYRILHGGSSLTFRQLFDLLKLDGDFVGWYSGALAAFDTDAFYWELPPLTTSTIDHAAEFVLLDAPILARLPPDPAPFAPQLDSRRSQDVVVFPNLGGDAILVVPAAVGPAEAYPHLAAFLRLAPKEQVITLWRIAAKTMLSRLGNEPTWLSTAGGGVAWLHLRLDSRPKYYRYRPYI